ncbi:hypothetical protein [Actinomadura fibrosa]|uniref:Uncharacterized protein n=1 Tax=Actinomadura fibrosa TaxID=111802 RepID=A0ABW2XJN0_9ACTN|nr:hypothetical protein [Actinomadura fibrosa]
MEYWLLFLPDRPVEWAIWIPVLAALAWWAYREVPRLLFVLFLARRMARENGWSLRFHRRWWWNRGERPRDGAARWDDGPLPDTHIELLGEYRGHVFHARQRRVKVSPRRVWRYDHVVTLAMTAPPAASGEDLRLACYPAFMAWERDRFEVIDVLQPGGLDGLRRGDDLVSVEKYDGRLSRGLLLKYLDALADAAGRPADLPQPDRSP